MSSILHPKWTADRPHTLVVACSDGRLQEQTDAFLHEELGIGGFDRFYIPGGGGALASSGRDFLRAQQHRKECAYLIELHDVQRVILIFHGPGETGPPDAVCADYRRKLAWASPALIHDRQRLDAVELVERRGEWACNAAVEAYFCNIDASHEVTFTVIDTS